MGELFDGTLGQNLARWLRETFNWTLDLTERLTADLTIDSTERVILRGPAILRLDKRDWIVFD